MHALTDHETDRMTPALRAWATRRARDGGAAGSVAARKAWGTRRANAGGGAVVVDERVAYIARLRTSMGNAIGLARRRQAERAAQGKLAAKVSITLDEAMTLLAENGYHCALTGLPFYEDEATGSFGLSRPSLDRIEAGGDYSAGNVRVVYLGVNSLRGCGSDADMLRIASAIVERANGTY